MLHTVDVELGPQKTILIKVLGTSFPNGTLSLSLYIYIDIDKDIDMEPLGKRSSEAEPQSVEDIHPALP